MGSRNSMLRDYFLTMGQWSLLLCLVSVPVNKPATNIFIFLALLGSLLGSRLRARVAAAVRKPVPLDAALWLLILALSALHAPAETQRWHELGTCNALLYPLIAASFLETQQWRQRGL